MDVEIELDVLGQAVGAGDRLRLAVSTTYWPWIWPSPEVTTITVHAGEGSWLTLPTRPLDVPDGDVRVFGPPEQAVPPPGVTYDEVDAFHVIERDVVTGEIAMRMNQDGDMTLRLPDGLVLDEVNRDRYRIVEGDPTSAEVEANRSLTMSRGDWSVRIETRSRMTSTPTHFRLEDTLEAWEGEAQVFERTWSRDIARDHV
jgi:hypothetical protein